jgi:hypothetical protein
MEAIENAAFISLGGASNVAGLSGYAHCAHTPHFKLTEAWMFLHNYHWRSIDRDVYSLRTLDRSDYVDGS